MKEGGEKKTNKATEKKARWENEQGKHGRTTREREDEMNDQQEDRSKHGTNTNESSRKRW